MKGCARGFFFSRAVVIIIARLTGCLRLRVRGEGSSHSTHLM